MLIQKRKVKLIVQCLRNASYYRFTLTKEKRRKYDTYKPNKNNTIHKEKYHDHLYTKVHISINTIMRKKVMNFMINVIYRGQILSKSNVTQYIAFV